MDGYCRKARPETKQGRRPPDPWSLAPLRQSAVRVHSHARSDADITHDRRRRMSVLCCSGDVNKQARIRMDIIIVLDGKATTGADSDSS